MSGFKVDIKGSNGCVERLLFDGDEIAAVDDGTHGWGFDGSGPRKLSNLLTELVAKREAASEADASVYGRAIEIAVISWPKTTSCFTVRLPSVKRVTDI